MATYNAIAATSRAILGLLEGACPKPEFDGALFELYQARSFQKRDAEGVSLYCTECQPARGGTAVADRANASIPSAASSRLYYLLTAWARTARSSKRFWASAIRFLRHSDICRGTA